MQSMIGEAVQQLNAGAELVGECTTFLAFACGQLDDIRNQLTSVLADSQAPEVSHSFEAAGHAIDSLSTAQRALQEAQEETLTIARNL